MFFLSHFLFLYLLRYLFSDNLMVIFIYWMDLTFLIINCILRTDLVPAYVRLLRDNEAEVRIAAAGKVTKFCRILSPELAIQHILPCVKVHMLLNGF